jgi:hypothetical protein
MAISGATIHVVYQDDDDGNFQYPVYPQSNR